jgi:hypothetical protein
MCWYSLSYKKNLFSLVRAMTVVGPGRSKFTKFVTDHVFGHEYRNKLFAIVDGKGHTDKIRKNRGTP